jgi:NADH-quinone oxidoreductase subunit G
MANVKVYIDHRTFEVSDDQNMLRTCLQLGFDLPYFCWHPALGSVGACRQCAVKQYRDADDKRGRIVMACMTPATEGLRVSIHDSEAVAFRAGVIEGLMESHPHDCPVCDEGGECHLQDMTVMTGHNYRRYRFNKRTFHNQELGPLVNHEMNRCIQCYRCVRYYREYAGGKDLEAFALRNLVYFGRHEDGVLESEFAGNLVEICPTGVFTDKTLKQHYTRKWDLQFAPSICVHCGIGCNISPGERYGALRRVVNRYHGEVNGYFLCDRGRFGYEFVNSDRRVRQPLVRRDGSTGNEVTFEAVSKSAAMDRLRGILDGGKVLGIGSPRASLEANLALRAWVGAERFHTGVGDAENWLTGAMLGALRDGKARSPSLHDVELSDAVLVLGEDVTQTAPRLALSVRQSLRWRGFELADRFKIPRWLDHAVRETAQDLRSPLYVATPHSTKLDDVAAETFHTAPDDLARLGFAVAHAIDSESPEPPGLSDTMRALAQRIAEALKNARRPLVISGPSLCSEAVIQAAVNVAWALCRSGKPAGLSFATPECNTFGLGMMPAHPLSEALDALKQGQADTIIVLEDDLYARAPKEFVDQLFAAARHVIVLDSLLNRTSEKAEMILPAATFAECEGTLVSNEGRAQRFFQTFVPEGDIQASWQWIRDVMTATGRREAAAWDTVDDALRTLAETVPALAGAAKAAPDSAFRAAGAKIPREPHRYSGRTAMLANINVSEPRPPADPESALAFSMEGFPDQPPSALTPFFWSPGWNSIQSVNKFQEEIAGPLRGGDPGVRLIEPGADGRKGYWGAAPAAFQPKTDAWQMVPLYHIFGSEELSQSAPAIAELVPKAYVALNEQGAAQLGLKEGDEVEVKVNGWSRRVALRVRGDLPRGVAGLPARLPDLDYVALPAWGNITKAG